MEEQKQNKLASYITSLVFAMTVFFVGALAWDLFAQTELLTIVKILSDCFFLPGVLLVGIALIGWVSTKGTFDIFGYSFRGLIGLFKSESYYKTESFYDYRVKKDEKRKPFNKAMMLVGLVFLALGTIGTIVFLMLE